MSDQDEEFDSANLGRLHRARVLLDTEPTRGLIELAALARSGSVMAMIYMAEACRYGRGTSVDLVEAEKWYRSAISKGSLQAHYFLARLCLDQKRYAEAREVLGTAAVKNYAPAAHLLGRLYFSGKGMEKDVAKAEHLFSFAANRGSVLAKGALAHVLLSSPSNLSRRLRGACLLLSAWIGLIVVVLTEGRSSERLK